MPVRTACLLLLAMLAVATDAWAQGAAARGGGAGFGRAAGPGAGSRITGPGRGGGGGGTSAGRGVGPYIPPDLSGTGYGQEAMQAERRAGILTQSYLFAETGETLSFAVFVPGRVNEDEPSPLVIGLHGMGGQPGMFVSQIRDRANKGGYIVAAPMGYNPYGGYGAYPEGIRTDDPRVSEWSERDVMNVLAIMREQYNIDDNRIYLVGQSMGGAGALYLGRKYPEIWAAVAATAPAVRNADAIDFADVTELPFILVHGDADPAVPVDVSRRLALKMKALDMSFEYYEVRRGGHSDAILKGAKPVFEFFDAHVKGAAPVD